MKPHLTLLTRHVAWLPVLIGGLLPRPVSGQNEASRGPRFLSTPVAGAPALEIGDAPPLQHRVSLALDHVSLRAALEEIGRQAHLHLLASREVVPLDHTVSIHATDVTVGAALFDLLEGLGLDIQLSRDLRFASLVPKPGRPQPRGRIAGRVVEAATRVPVDRVRMRIVELSLTAVTGKDGRYVIGSVPAGVYRLVAQRIGYAPLSQTISVVVDSVRIADFSLTAAPTVLTQIVTTAVGDQRRYQVGNVISTINADSLVPLVPATSLTDIVSARAPGVEVIESSGLTGAGASMRIRGQSSLVLQGDPIVIVDGVRQDNTPGGSYVTAGFAGSVPSPSRINDVSVTDIQSIDFLKGPAASTEYGTDAANGVVVITTRRGGAGRAQWRAGTELSTSAIPVAFPTFYRSWGHTTDGSQSPVQCPLVPFASGFGSAAGTCAVDSVTAWDPLNHPAYSIFGSGSREKYDLSVGGSSDAVRYFVSGALSNETGILRLPAAFSREASGLGLPHSARRPNGEGQRSVRSNTLFPLGADADVSVNAAYLSTHQEAPNSQELYRGVIESRPVRDSADGFGYGTGSLDPVYIFGQPIAQQTDRLTGGLTASWRPTAWFVGRSTVGIDHGSQQSRAELFPQVAPLFPLVPGQLGIGNTTADIYSADLRGSATVSLTSAVRAVSSVGLQFADARMQGTTTTAFGLTAANQTLNGATSLAVAQLGNRQATLGGYGEEEVGIAERLFLTAALRIDAGSGFGRAYATALYPKASISWLTMSGGPSSLRLRGAFGQSGVQPPNGSALQLYAPATNWLNGGLVSTVSIANAENPHLQPERSSEFEAGADLGLGQNRVSLELTAYSKTTRNALVSLGTGWELGGFPFVENIGKVRNSGIEGALTAAIVQTRRVSWDVSVNGSINHNTLVTLAPGVLAQQLTGVSAVYRFAPGFPLYGFWAPQVHYADANHDHIIEPTEVQIADSLTYIGSSIPTRELSLGSHLGLWGGALTLHTLFDYRGGFRVANTTAFFAASLFQSDYASNFRSASLADQARAVAANEIELGGVHGVLAEPAGFYEDGTFVRFRELSLTYQLPQRFSRALRAGSISVTGAVRNLVLWTRYRGSDPEVSNLNGANALFNPTSNTFDINNDLREDSQAVPLLRYWVMRLNLGF